MSKLYQVFHNASRLALLLAVGMVLLGMVPAVTYAQFSSDDFNGCELDPSVWTIVDPLGDSDDPSIIGAYSGDSQVGNPRCRWSPYILLEWHHQHHDRTTYPACVRPMATLMS